MMDHPNKFLQIKIPDDYFNTNCVTVDQNGFVDPHTQLGELDAPNGATYMSTTNLAFDLDLETISREGMGLNGEDTYVCHIPRGTPIPDSLRLWMTIQANPDYILRSRMPMTMLGLQKLLSEFQGKHGQITSFNDYFASALGPSEDGIPDEHWQQQQIDCKVRSMRAGVLG